MLPTFNRTVFLSAMTWFQQAWGAWMYKTYPAVQVVNPIESTDRFAEEAFEAMQAFGMSKERAMHMLEVVYAKPPGEPAQEAAGALNCLVTLCNARQINLGQAAIDDMEYCEKHIVEIRNKNALKPRYKEPTT